MVNMLFSDPGHGSTKGATAGNDDHNKYNSLHGAVAQHMHLQAPKQDFDFRTFRSPLISGHRCDLALSVDTQM